MKTATFSCPHCLSPLRIRDRAFTERKIDCPECGEALEITLDRDNEPRARKAEESAPPKKRKTSRPMPPRRTSRRKKKSQAEENQAPAKTLPKLNQTPLFDIGGRLPEVFTSPVGIAWAVAALVAILLGILAWPQSGADAPEENPAEEQIASVEPEETQADTDLEIPGPDVKPADNEADSPAVRKRLESLGGVILLSTKEQGHFPPGTVAIGDLPVDERFSWLAELFAEHAEQNIKPPQWDQPWNDILNDRFVRQPNPLFVNPALQSRVGQDGYPATHFVGVAGVGQDAPELPVDHPRAGIFGWDRITRESDIVDGTANTMMVAGVNDRLGSWASGKAGMRAFTAEPYFGGPDGFGTGETGGMSVLMADGSVRFLADSTSPAVVRSLAAMADGAPAPTTNAEKQPLALINHSLPKPKVVQKPARPKTVQVEIQPPENVAVDEAEVEQPIDIPEALAVKIGKFEQIQSAPFRDLLLQVEEMVGVPIRRGADLPDQNDDLWIQPVSLRLKDVTVGEILDALLKKANLRYTVETDHLRLESAE